MLERVWHEHSCHPLSLVVKFSLHPSLSEVREPLSEVRESPSDELLLDKVEVIGHKHIQFMIGHSVV